MSRSFWDGFEKRSSAISSAGHIVGRIGGRIVNRGAQIAAVPGKFTSAVRQGYRSTKAAPVAKAPAPAAAAAKAPAAAPAPAAANAQRATRRRMTAAEYLKKNPEAAAPAAAKAPAPAPRALSSIKDRVKKFQGRGTDIVGGGLVGAGGAYMLSGDSSRNSAYGY